MMLLWTYKLFASIRKVIAGRRYPSQLAWAVALGLLLGLLPHGNLVAAAVLLLVVAVRVNHAMAGLTTIAVTLVAPKLDPVFHAVGQRILTQPEVVDRLSNIWDRPLIAWTDLNNTVVMGSFTVGLASMPFAVLLTYPVFKLSAKGLIEKDRREAEEQQRRQQRLESNRVQRQRDRQTISAEAQHPPVNVATSGRVFDIRRLDVPSTNPVPSPARTRVEIKPATSRERFSNSTELVTSTTDAGSVADANVADLASSSVAAAVAESATKHASPTNPSTASTTESASNEQPQDDQQKIDEALRYLLRQLRDSNEKEVA
ncbi:MAG: TIGR03546 family protein [Planctomycetota bacterium]